MKLALFGCKTTTLFLLDALMTKMRINVVITITPELAAKNEVADYLDLSDACQNRGIRLYQANTYHLNDAADQETIRQFQIDIAFVNGWQRLLPKSILQAFRLGAFGMHGSAQNLPVGRGRSPMNWSLIEGKTHFFTNLFRYDAGIDSGDILDTHVFSIQSADTAETLHFKNTLAMSQLILKNLNPLLEGKFSLNKQADLPPTYYPKRSPADSIIDWRRDIHFLHRFIRAVAPPFNGAFSYINRKKITLLRAEIFETDIADHGFTQSKPGRVVAVFPGQKFLVRVNGGLLIVHDFLYCEPVITGMLLSSPEQEIRCFPVNAAGGYDLP